MNEEYPANSGKKRHRLMITALRVSAIAIIILAAIMFVVEFIQDIQSLGKLGTIEPADLDYLLNLMVVIASVMILYVIFKDVLEGNSLFTDSNTDKFLIVGTLIVVKIVVSVAAQIMIISIYPNLGRSIVFPMDVVLSGFMMFMLYFICKQGSRLQEDVDSIV